MPNHCHNDVYISGPEAQLAALLTLIGADKPEPEFNFSAVIPYPENYAALDRDARALTREAFSEKHGENAKDGFNSGGYEWCSANWGTKWNAYEVARRDYNGACVTFQTAWNAPMPVLVALHKLFPECEIHLEYFECGMELSGGFSLIPESDWYDDEPWSAGKVTSAWTGTYRGHRGG
jgi:hypothetical protein